MKKLCLGFVLFAFIAAFADTNEQVEIDFLLFMPNSSNQFADESLAMEHLDNMARYLTARNVGTGQIHVHGFAAAATNDVDPASLSKDRALFVISELQRRGVPAKLFAEPAAFGSVDFWGDNKDEDQRAPNRRVRIFLDGYFLSPTHIDAFINDEIVKDKSPYIFPWWILILLPLLLLLLFFASKRKKKVKPAASKVPLAAASTTSYTIVNLEDEIRFHAYELYIERNGQNGDRVTDWLKSVIEVCARYKVKGYKTYPKDNSWWARK